MGIAAIAKKLARSVNEALTEFDDLDKRNEFRREVELHRILDRQEKWLARKREKSLMRKRDREMSLNEYLVKLGQENCKEGQQ